MQNEQTVTREKKTTLLWEVPKRLSKEGASIIMNLEIYLV